MVRVRFTALLICLLMPASATAGPAGSPPTLDCAQGFDGLRTAVQSLGAAQWHSQSDAHVATFELPDTWRAQIAFTTPRHPAHPSVTIRTQRKQVTGVWTADSKGCGYGDPARFSELMASMKATDTELTNASRAEAAREQDARSPLSPP